MGIGTGHSYPSLSQREEVILKSVVKNFIRLAGPIGSRYLSRQNLLGLSAASIRNTLSDLEELGYLDHPYTSAGRIPTELGYRVYVDRLMETTELSDVDKVLLAEQLKQAQGDTEKLLRETARLMGQLTNLLAVALAPTLSKGTLHRLDVVPVSNNRAMFIISIESGFVKTIMMRLECELQRRQLDHVVQLLNERLSGLTLEEIRNTLAERVRDLTPDDGTGVIQIILKEADQLFSEPPEERRLQVSGANKILRQPEFHERERVEKIFELLENEQVVVHFMEQRASAESDRESKVMVTIGSENLDSVIEEYSLVTSRYVMGNATGVIGLLGPTRMEYARAIALVDHVAEILSNVSGSA